MRLIFRLSETLEFHGLGVDWPGRLTNCLDGGQGCHDTFCGLIVKPDSMRVKDLSEDPCSAPMNMAWFKNNCPQVVGGLVRV